MTFKHSFKEKIISNIVLFNLHQQTILLKPKNTYSFLRTFCLRTPLLPLTSYRELTGQSLTYENYKTLWDDPILKEAIFLASPILYTEIDKWLLEDKVPPKDQKRLQNSFLKYIARISSRCTPFGLFAGCSIGNFQKETELTLDNPIAHQRQTRFDMNLLVAWSDILAKDQDIRFQLYWYPNTSLYAIGNQYRYIEYEYDTRGKRVYSIEAITKTPYLESILVKAKKGAAITELANTLVDDDISIEEATDFILQLIDNQLLVSSLEPSVCGDGFLIQIQNVLSNLNNTNTVQKSISQYQQALAQLDQHIGNAVQPYLEITNDLKNNQIPLDPKYLFQTDLYPKLQSDTLDQKWGYRLQRLLTLFNKLTPSRKENNLSRFASAFNKRYETREVPLTTVLDTEVGIGYLQHQSASDSHPFLEGLQIPTKGTPTQTFDWSNVQEFLFHKLESSPAYTSLEITDEEVKDFETRWDDLPNTFSAMTELVVIDGQEKMFVSSAGGGSSTKLLGRFTANADVKSMVDQIAQIEKELQPNEILAEITHLPESRIGNVIQRATFRAYEIPYLGKSNLPTHQQIPIEDLMVSVKSQKVYLRSKRLNKYIIPCLSNAHNYSANSLPIYHFLCDLQGQKLRTSIGFYWGAALEKRAFLPRVVYKDFILSKAQWNISKETLQRLLQFSEDDLIPQIRSWRQENHIPQWVQLVDGDNTLLINLENKETVFMWLDTVKKRSGCLLQEFLFTENCVVSHNEKGFTNQIVVSFHKNQE